MVADQNPHFIMINEAWTNDSISDAFLKIDGYDLVCRHDRKDTSAGIGGGLLVWTRKSLKVSEYVAPSLEKFNQSCAIRIPLSGGQSVTLVLVYRPHNLYKSSDSEKINNEKLCNILRSIEGPSVFIGDFNYSDIDWQHMSALKISSREFLETTQDCFLTQHVDFATRVESMTMPDLVLSTDDSLVLNVSDVGKIGSSDHSMLMVQVAGQLADNITMEEVLDWNKADMDKLSQELSRFDWEKELAGLNTQQSWDKFKEKLLLAQELSIPKKRRRISNRPVWMNQNAIRVIRKKRRLWKEYKHSKDHAQYLAYKKVEKTVQDTVRKAKKKYEQKLAKGAKKNPRAFWSYIKSKRSNRQSVGPLSDGGTLLTDDEKQAEVLNAYFTSVFTKEDLHDLPSMDPMYDGESLQSTPFSAEIVKDKIENLRSSDKIENLRSSAAPGPDGICPRVLQGVVDVISAPLAAIYTKSLEEGMVPEDWKCANITPIFKKGSKASAGNYRPVSLTSILCKVMESILRDAIVELGSQQNTSSITTWFYEIQVVPHKPAGISRNFDKTGG